MSAWGEFPTLFASGAVQDTTLFASGPIQDPGIIRVRLQISTVCHCVMSLACRGANCSTRPLDPVRILHGTSCLCRRILPSRVPPVGGHTLWQCLRAKGPSVCNESKRCPTGKTPSAKRTVLPYENSTLLNNNNTERSENASQSVKAMQHLYNLPECYFAHSTY